MTAIKVAFLGLGVMGYPMAGHLKTKGGYDVTVYNRTSAKASKWAEQFGGNHAATPAEAARDADFVFSCVGNDDDLREVTTGPNGAFATMKRMPCSSITRQLQPKLHASLTGSAKARFSLHRCASFRRSSWS